MSDQNNKIKEGPPKETLVKYGQPIELGHISEYSNLQNRTTTNDIKKVNVEGKPSIDSLLQVIIPPREWVEDSKVYIQ